MKKRHKRYIKLGLKALISVSFVIWLIYRIDWSEVLIYVEKIEVWHVFLYIALYLVSMLISAYKWRIITKSKQIYSNLWDLSVFYLTGTFINNFMPSFIGGDAYRSYEVGKRSQNEFAQSASTVIFDRVTGFLATFILVIIFSLFNFKKVLESPILIITNILILSSFGIDAALIMIRRTPLWVFIKKLVPESIIRVAQEMKSFSGNKKILYSSILWGMIFNFVGVAVLNWIIFWSLNIRIDLLDYLSVIFLISIVTAAPISINNIGISEWAYVTFFGIFGVNPAAVVTIPIMTRFFKMFASFFVLPLYMKNKNWKEEIAVTKDLFKK